MQILLTKNLFFLKNSFYEFLILSFKNRKYDILSSRSIEIEFVQDIV